MKPRFIIIALGLSHPGTMGGNSKITIETARHLCSSREVHFIVPEGKLATLTDNVVVTDNLRVHTVKDFPGDDKFHPLQSVRWFLPQLRDTLKLINADSSDFVFSCSDFHVDVLPAYLLQKEFNYRWLPSFFLFIPTIFENLLKGYRFPKLKYIIYRVYQRILFALSKSRAAAFIVTNKSDFNEFPRRFHGKLFDFYGGVNVEQIPAVPRAKTRDVVFCSRLHPQKGIDAFLETWKIVHNAMPSVKLTVIGNGDSIYEHYLKAKAERLAISGSIDWLGYVNNKAKFSIYAESRLFVHPTVFDNNGMVAAEALCSGLPVVMQDLPSLREVYATGCNKVPFGDKRAFAKAIIELLRSSAALAALAPNAEQVAELRARWNWSTRVAEFDAFLERLCETSE